MTTETHSFSRQVSNAPLDAKTFRRWHKPHKFPTHELALDAEMIERDLALLPQLGPHNTESRAVIMKNLAAFADAMAAA